MCFSEESVSRINYARKFFWPASCPNKSCSQDNLNRISETASHLYRIKHPVCRPLPATLDPHPLHLLIYRGTTLVAHSSEMKRCLCRAPCDSPRFALYFSLFAWQVERAQVLDTFASGRNTLISCFIQCPLSLYFLLRTTIFHLKTLEGKELKFN